GGGMERLAQALASALPAGAARTRTSAVAVRRAGARFAVDVETEGRTSVEEADAVVVALPASAAARVLEPLDRELARDLAAIEARVAAVRRLALAGASYRGVGVPDCIAGGEAAADKVLRDSTDP